MKNLKRFMFVLLLPIFTLTAMFASNGFEVYFNQTSSTEFELNYLLDDYRSDLQTTAKETTKMITKARAKFKRLREKYEASSGRKYNAPGVLRALKTRTD